MPSTPVFALPYPSATDAPDGPTQMQALAQAVETTLSNFGWVGDSSRTTTSATFTSEIVLQSVTFTAIPTARYEFTAYQSVQSTVALDRVRVRIRIQSGGTLTTSGTELTSSLPVCQTVNIGELVSLSATATGLSGQQTVGVTATRDGGTGTLSSFADVRQVDYLVVKRV